MCLFTVRKACLDNAHKNKLCFSVYFILIQGPRKLFDRKITFRNINLRMRSTLAHFQGHCYQLKRNFAARPNSSYPECPPLLISTVIGWKASLTTPLAGVLKAWYGWNVQRLGYRHVESHSGQMQFFWMKIHFFNPRKNGPRLKKNIKSNIQLGDCGFSSFVQKIVLSFFVFLLCAIHEMVQKYTQHFACATKYVLNEFLCDNYPTHFRFVIS